MALYLGGLVHVPLAAGVVLTIATTIGNADAGYVIQLKNGNDYVTARHWREGNQVLFDTYGGVFGIEKNFVARITKIDDVAGLSSASYREPATNLLNKGLNDKKELRDNGSDAPLARTKADDNDPIRGEFNRLKEKVNEVDGMLTAEIRELLNQITAFKNKLSRDSKLFIQYGREFNDAHDLGNTVETALVSRTQ
jgi:hypothetical protein